MKHSSILLSSILLFKFLLGQEMTNSKLDSLISETISKNNIPSLAVAIINSNSILYGIHGKVRIDKIREVQLTDKYHIGSNTKAFTSFLAFQAIEEEIIKLETKFIQLYPELEDETREEYKEMTLGDLLSHQALVRPYTSGKEYKNLPKFEGNASDKRYEFAKYILQQKPVAKGEYSNAGYVLAALMLEKLYDLPFESILKNSMDEMNIEVFFGFPNKQNVNYPWGHWKEKNNLVPLSPKHDYKLHDYMMPAGDLSINIIDYSKFIQKHLNGILGLDSVLKQESFEKLFYEQKPNSYGWGNQINDKGKLAFHDGSAGTFYCHTLISSTYKFAIIMVMNSAEDTQVEDLYELRNKLFQVRNELE